MPQHLLDARRENLHGHWSRELPPVLEIDPGDSVHFTTLDAMWCDGRPVATPWKRVAPLAGRRDDGHALTGPVFVRGARPGMTLEIRIGAIVPGDWAWTWSWPSIGRVRELGLAGLPNAMRLWDLDVERMQAATDERGRTTKLRPFMGVMGVAPPEPGEHATTPPRVWGGNIDCKELVSGTTLYLPIGVEGALFSTGDGHGAQGDGEVCGTAIECPMKRVELTFDLVDAPLKAPRAKTADAWLTFGFDEDLNRAMLMALNGMLDLIQEQRGGMDRQEALLLASLAVDLRITQIVNRAQGVHAVLPIDAVAGSG